MIFNKITWKRTICKLTLGACYSALAISAISRLFQMVESAPIDLDYNENLDSILSPPFCVVSPPYLNKLINFCTNSNINMKKPGEILCNFHSPCYDSWTGYEITLNDCTEILKKVCKPNNETQLKPIGELLCSLFGYINDIKSWDVCKKLYFDNHKEIPKLHFLNNC